MQAYSNLRTHVKTWAKNVLAKWESPKTKFDWIRLVEIIENTSALDVSRKMIIWEKMPQWKFEFSLSEAAHGNFSVIKSNILLKLTAIEYIIIQNTPTWWSPNPCASTCTGALTLTYTQTSSVHQRRSLLEQDKVAMNFSFTILILHMHGKQNIGHKVYVATVSLMLESFSYLSLHAVNPNNLQYILIS